MSAALPRRTALFTKQELALLLITMVWGTTFVIVHQAMRHSGPLFFVGVRFITAGLLSLALFRPKLRGLTGREALAGGAIGLAIFLGYGLQTYGLCTINSSTSAFLTGLYVPMVPLLQWLVLRRPPRLLTWGGIALAFAGLSCIAGPAAWHVGLGRGETATLIGAAAIAAEILLIGGFAGSVDSTRVTLIQLFAAGLCAFAAMPLAGEHAPGFSWVWLLAALGLGLASALIQLTMNWAQKSVSPARATIIYAGEPVWGGIAGRLAGDTLPALAVLGAGLIVAGIIVSELQPPRPPAG
ncbi:DMT family transporter [Acidocella sp.]|uniref:DMT family transporter n=1 Tax=Acidocella sp. TaxID=50710 RepID=UPI0026204390|nr:DMT family transporter [Acidocella sp.]